MENVLLLCCICSGGVDCVSVDLCGTLPVGKGLLSSWRMLLVWKHLLNGDVEKLEKRLSLEPLQADCINVTFIMVHKC
jgi:hypothetical protein